MHTELTVYNCNWNVVFFILIDLQLVISRPTKETSICSGSSNSIYKLVEFSKLWLGVKYKPKLFTLEGRNWFINHSILTV